MLTVVLTLSCCPLRVAGGIAGPGGGAEARLGNQESLHGDDLPFGTGWSRSNPVQQRKLRV